MAHWRCGHCGYLLKAEAPPNECPSCKRKCEFVDTSCYTPDCADKGVDERIGSKKA